MDADSVHALAGVRPRVTVGRLPEGAPVVVSPTEMEDFHPDLLDEVLPRFLDVDGDGSERRSPPPPGRAPTDEGAPAGGSGLLDDILERAHPTERLPTTGGELADFIEAVVGPHRVDPAAAEGRIGQREQARARIRQVLRVPAFAQLESTWRSLFELVRRTSAARHVRLALVDGRAGDADGVLRSLAEGPAHAGPGEDWGLIVVLSDIGESWTPTVEALASRLRTPVVAGWPVRTDTGPAAGVTWGAPRWLARLPYAPGVNECMDPEFTEFTTADRDAVPTWGSAAVPAALLRIEAMSPAGTRLRFEGEGGLDDFPYHVYAEGPEAGVLGPLESLEAETARTLMEYGVQVFRPAASPGGIEPFRGGRGGGV